MKQQIWRTRSKPTLSGYFAWEVMQVTGTPEQLRMMAENASRGTYLECRDGSYILIQCYHFFTYDSLADFMYLETETPYQTVEFISTYSG